MVRSTCDDNTINEILVTGKNLPDRFQHMLKFKLDAHKEWLASLIIDVYPQMVEGKPIEKKYMNIVGLY